MSDSSQGEGWWQASDGKWYPPEKHPDYKPPPPDAPPPPVSRTASSFTSDPTRRPAAQGFAFEIREEGKNGAVHIENSKVVRTLRKRMGKDDRQAIQASAIQAVHHDRKTLGTDVVVLRTAVGEYQWKVKNSRRAEQLVREIENLL